MLVYLYDEQAFYYSGLTKNRIRRRAADSTDSTARRGNAVLVFVNSLYFRISEGFAGSSLILQYLGLDPLNRSIVCFKPDKE